MNRWCATSRCWFLIGLAACDLDLPLPLEAPLAVPTCQPGMAYIPEATTFLGCPPSEDCGGIYKNSPKQKDTPTTVAGFCLDLQEVSQKDWRECAEASPECIAKVFDPEGEMLPAHSLTYDEATKFCAAKGKRLPTEEEWERAAQGDGLANRRRYVWVSNDDPVEGDPLANVRFRSTELPYGEADEACKHCCTDTSCESARVACNQERLRPGVSLKPVDDPDANVTDQKVRHMIGNVSEITHQNVESGETVAEFRLRGGNSLACVNCFEKATCPASTCATPCKTYDPAAPAPNYNLNFAVELHTNNDQNNWIGFRCADEPL